MSPRARLAVTAVLALTAALGAGRRALTAREQSDRPAAPDEDARAYWAGAVNLSRAGVYSADPPEEPGPKTPAAARGLLYPAVLSWADDGAPGAGFAWRANAAAGAAAIVAACALGWAAAGWPWGLAAGALTAWEPRGLLAMRTLDIQIFFSLLVALLGLSLLAWGRRPTPGRAALAGFIAGTGLMARSTLLPLPLLLAAWLWPRRREISRPALQWVCFAAAMAAAAAPVWWRNAALLGRPLPAEAKTLEFVLAAGAAGVVSDDYPMEWTDGPSRRALYATAEDWSELGLAGALRAAAAGALEHPRRFLAAAALRALNLWGWWLLALLPAWAAARRRGRLDLWTLLALPALWGAHLLILSSARHLIAVIPALSAAALAWAGPPPAAAAVRRAGAAAAALCALLWLAGALPAAREALSAGPGEGAAALLLTRAETAARRGKTADARAAADELERRGLHERHILRVARLRQSAGDWRGCRRLAEEAARRWPRWARALNDAAVCAAQDGDSRGAERLARAALAAAPDHADAALTLGALLEKRGGKGEAAAVYDAMLARPGAPEDERRQALARARAALRALSQPTATRASSPR